MAKGIVRHLLHSDFPAGGCELNKKAIRCDRVPLRVRAMHLSAALAALAANGAPYESVVAMLDSLDRDGINDVFLMPPFLGTNPSSSVNHWIKFVVEGVLNNPFPMVLVATERFRTWREHLIVIPGSEFATVDHRAIAKIERGDCAASVEAIRKDLLEREHMLLLFDHGDDGTRSCLLPRATTSCEYLAEVAGRTNVAWGTRGLEAIRSVAADIGCIVRN